MYSVWCALRLSGNNEPSIELYAKDTIQDIRCLKSRRLKVKSLLAQRILFFYQRTTPGVLRF